MNLLEKRRGSFIPCLFRTGANDIYVSTFRLYRPGMRFSVIRRTCVGIVSIRPAIEKRTADDLSTADVQKS